MLAEMYLEYSMYLLTIFSSITNEIIMNSNFSKEEAKQGASIIITIGCHVIYYIKIGGIFIIVGMGSWICIKYIVDGRVEGMMIILLGVSTVILIYSDNLVIAILTMADPSEMADFTKDFCKSTN